MQLKPVTAAGIPAALQKAERYRLLNDSTAAGSICLDILHVEPANQQALVTLLLSLTDQFSDGRPDGVERGREYSRVMRPSGNDEALLRWNSCVRLLGTHERARGEEEYEPAFED